MTQERPADLPVIPWPNSVGEDGISKIRVYQAKGKSLAASVASTIIDEASELGEQQRVQNRRWYRERVAIGGSSKDLGREVIKGSKNWWDFAKPAYALLNAEELLRSGETFQNPGETWEVVGKRMLVEWEESHKKFGDPFSSDGEDDKVFQEIVDDKMAGETTEWYLQQQSFVDILRNNDPLGFIDRATKLLCDQLLDYEDDKKEPLEQGKQYFHQLYTAALQPNS